MAQETRFVRTREDLQKVLDEIAYLSRGDQPPQEYFNQLLRLLLMGAGSHGGAVWIPQGGEFRYVSSAEFAALRYEGDAEQQQSIQRALRDATGGRRPVVVGPTGNQPVTPDGIINHSPFPFFYMPVLVTEVSGTVTAMAVLHLWMPPDTDPRSFTTILNFLQAAAKSVAIYMRARHVESLAATAQRLQQLLKLVAELAAHTDVAPLAIAVANGAREVCDCDRCALFGLNDRQELVPLAVSNVEVLDPKSSLVQTQSWLAEDTLENGKPSLFRKSSPKSEAHGDISDYFFHSGAVEALALPLVGRNGQKTGVLLLESNKENHFEAGLRGTASTVAGHVGRALGTTQEIAGLPFLRTLRRWQQVRAALRADRRKELLLKIGVPAAILLLLALWPWRLSVGGECHVLPRERAVAVSEPGGRIVAVLVTEGQAVQKGQALARVDDTDLQQSLRITEQEKAKYEAEADRLQMMSEDGGRRIALMQAGQIDRQLEQLRRKLAKTTIVSPVDGVVLTKDLQSRVGALMPVGGQFCEVGNLKQWEAQIRIGESDVSLLDPELRRGRKLSAELLLRSKTSQPLTATITDLKDISQMSYQVGHDNVFLVRAAITGPPELVETLKSGYTGQGNIPIGRRPIGYLMTRRFINYIRLHWFF